MTENKPLTSTMRIDLLTRADDASDVSESVCIRPATTRRKRPIRITVPRPDATPPLGGTEFQELLQSVYDAALITDDTGAVLEANVRAERFLGLPRAELCRHNIVDLISGADEGLLTAISTSLQDNRFILVQACCARENGTLFPAEISINRLHLSTLTYYCFFVRDITYRKQADERLRTGYNAIQNAGTGIAVADTDGRLTYVNPALALLLGHASVADVLGHALADVLGDPASAATVLASVAGNELWTGEVEARHADGALLNLQLAAAPNVNEDGACIGLVLSVLDITARKRTESELRIVMKELRRSNADLEQFAYVVSHDLQEPLRKITSFGDRLQTHCAGLTEEGRDYVRRMESAARRMQSLIQALLALSRVSTRARPFGSVDLNRVLREVLSDLEARLLKSGGTVDAGELPTVEGEEIQLRQLFQNLIGNALKFQHEGRAPLVAVRGRVLTPAEVQALELAPDDVYVPHCEITVTDNGIGFDPAHGQRIFGVFQRLHSHEAYEGTGIGLAICRKIVERHGGSIFAIGTPGEGACFTVRLPLHQPAGATEGRPQDEQGSELA